MTTGSPFPVCLDVNPQVLAPHDVLGNLNFDFHLYPEFLDQLTQPILKIYMEDTPFLYQKFGTKQFAPFC